MEKQTKQLEYRVGLFVAIGLLIAMISIVLISGKRIMLKGTLTLRANFEDVQGLFVGSVVSLSGLEVGNIKAIEFDQKTNKLQVIMSVNARYADRLVEGTTAEKRTQGALGDKYIFLIPGPLGQRELADNSVIESSDQDFLKLITSKEDGIGRVMELIKELHSMLAAINKDGKVLKITSNISETSDRLKIAMSDLSEILKNLRHELPENGELKKSLRALASTMEKIDHGQGTLGLLINDPSVHERLKTILGASSNSKYIRDVVNQSLEKSKP